MKNQLRDSKLTALHVVVVGIVVVVVVVVVGAVVVVKRLLLVSSSCPLCGLAAPFFLSTAPA